MLQELLGDASGMVVSGGLSAALGAGLTLVGKAVSFKHKLEEQKQAHTEAELKMILESRKQAVEITGAGGIWVRRFIVLALFGFLFGLLSFNGILGHWFESVPATYAYMEETAPRFFGLFRGRETLRTVPLLGIPVFEQAVNMMWLIGTFYFGSSRIK